MVLQVILYNLLFLVSGTLHTDKKYTSFPFPGLRSLKIENKNKFERGSVAYFCKVKNFTIILYLSCETYCLPLYYFLVPSKVLIHCYSSCICFLKERAIWFPQNSLLAKFACWKKSEANHLTPLLHLVFKLHEIETALHNRRVFLKYPNISSCPPILHLNICLSTQYNRRVYFRATGSIGSVIIDQNAAGSIWP